MALVRRYPKISTIATVAGCSSARSGPAVGRGRRWRQPDPGGIPALSERLAALREGLVPLRGSGGCSGTPGRRDTGNAPGLALAGQVPVRAVRRPIGQYREVAVSPDPPIASWKDPDRVDRYLARIGGLEPRAAGDTSSTSTLTFVATPDDLRLSISQPPLGRLVICAWTVCMDLPSIDSTNVLHGVRPRWSDDLLPP
jgi:hypothetical protein